MKKVVLFFPDSIKLAAYAAQLTSGPVEINSVHLTIKAILGKEQIADAKSYYEAVSCPTDSWEHLEQWLDGIRDYVFRYNDQAFTLGTKHATMPVTHRYKPFVGIKPIQMNKQCENEDKGTAQLHCFCPDDRTEQ